MTFKIDYESVFLILSNLYVYVSAGISITRALEFTKLSLKNKRYKVSIDKIKKDVERGCSLWEAFNNEEELYPSLVLDMIKLGEESGKLELILEKLAENTKKTYNMKQRLKKALIYPSFLLMSIMAVFIIYLNFILPSISNLYEDAYKDQGGFVQTIMKFSNFISKTDNGVEIISIVFLILFLVIFITFKLLKEKGYFKKLKVVKSFNEINIIMFLEMIVSSGIPVMVALEKIMKNISNESLKENVKELQYGLASGKNLSEALENIDSISYVTTNFILTGEETGKLEYNIKVLSDILRTQFNNRLEVSMQLAEPISLVILGFIVAFICICVFLPMYSYMRYV